VNNKILQKSLKNKISGAFYMPLSFDTAKGCIIKDIEGNKYIDLSSGYGVANIGWQNDEMLQHQIKCINKSNYAPPWLATKEADDLATKLISFFPNANYKCFRTTGGANGNEVAISVFYNINKSNIGTFERSYHGWSQATIGMGEIKKYKMPFVKKEYESKKIPPPNKSSLEEVDLFFKKNQDVKIFIAEPVLGSGGVIVPDKGYWKKFYKICQENEVFLIMDECITGFGRVGKMLACHHYDIEPDAIILGKGISSGYSSIGAVLVKEEHLKNYRFGDVSATFSWTPFACSVVLKNIEIIEKNKLCEKSKIIGELFKIKLTNIFKELNFDKYELRIIGSMIGLQFFNKENQPDIYLHGRLLYEFAKSNIIICTSGDNDSIIFLPPLSIDEKTLNLSISRIKKIFQTKFIY